MFKNKKIRRNLAGAIVLLFILAALNLVVPVNRISALTEAAGGSAGLGGASGAEAGAGAAGAVTGAGAYVAAAQAVIGAFQTNCGMGSGPSNFGGRVRTICKCKDGGMILKIGPPKGGNYYFGQGSIAFMFGPPKSGVWTLGLAGGTKVCFDLQKKPRPMSGSNIWIVGTSLF